MAVKMEDLPPWAQAQAQQKMAEQSRKKAPAPPAWAESKEKYHNVRTDRTSEAGGRVKFDSKKEARRYDELMAMLRAGQIRDLKLQPQFTIQEAYTTPEGQRVRAIRYQADFSYKRPTEPDCTGEIHWLRVVEDVKSRATKTRVYEIKKKLMREKLGIEIQEVKMDRQEDLLALEIELLQAAGRRYGLMLDRVRREKRDRTRTEARRAIEAAMRKHGPVRPGG